tara:strand:+ start:107 stop:487 length:381 start_codon:yes stop_codon:yes gene_type:complete
MGYRSEVVLVVGKEVMPQFMVTMAKSPDARSLCFAEATRHEDYEEKGNMLFAWDCIKWYDSYEEIRAIEDFLDWCDSEDVPSQDAKGERVSGDECYRFVRIGEEVEDIEERGSGFWDVGVRRSIEF